MMRVAAFTGGRTVPSTRFRVEQLREPLGRRGITVDSFVARFGSYPPPSRLARPAWLAATLADRLPGVLRSRQYDVTLLQRELVSTLETWERFTGRPRVLDVDDALWLYRGGGFIRRIAAGCDAVICGNAYLAEHFGAWNTQVHIVPTAVDTARFTPAPAADAGRPVIGWSGTSSNFPYLLDIEDALGAVLDARPEVIVRAVANAPPPFRMLPRDRVEFIPWSPATEVSGVQTMTVGVMPLPDTEWVRGKCSFKMLLYMACGIPAVVSPVGMNREVLALGTVGIGASTRAEWVEALLALVDEPARARTIGVEGRRVAERVFAVERIADDVASVLRGVTGTTTAG
jgi:glycosyltransferase involved in cell wall biosynthesis